MGDSDFVDSILKEAEQTFEKKYKLKIEGYIISKVEQKILKVFEIDKNELYSGSRKNDVSEARSIFCYLCVRELGESMTAMARKLGLSQPAVGYAVDRGKRVAEKRGLDLAKMLY